MKQMAFKKNNVIEDDFIWNNMFKNFILILSNTGMRVGEALQLRWRDVSTENVTFEGTKYRVATISVRAETSKWRKDRTFRSRNGNQFDKLKRISKYTRRDDFIFQNEIPMLAICRGFQEVNVAMGGSLFADIHEVPGRMDHRCPESDDPDIQFSKQHEVYFKENECGSLIGPLIGGRVMDIFGPIGFIYTIVFFTFIFLMISIYRTIRN